MHLSAAAPFNVNFAQIVVHFQPRLKLPDLQRNPVGVGITYRPKQHLRVCQIPFLHQQPHQRPQLGLQDARHYAH